MRYFTGVEGEERQIEINGGAGGLEARIGDRAVKVDLQSVRGRSWFSLIIDGRSHDLHVSGNGEAVTVSVGPHTYRVQVEDERTRAARVVTGGGPGASGPEVVASVMPGIVRSVAVTPGERIEKGAALLILEAMKMQNEIRAPRNGVVETVHVEGDTVVAKGDALITLAPPE